jgi:hypothetical protein
MDTVEIQSALPLVATTVATVTPHSGRFATRHEFLLKALAKPLAPHTHSTPAITVPPFPPPVG